MTTHFVALGSVEKHAAMGDLSTEPSMEDILASIKRIIAEDADGAGALRTRRRTVTPPVADFVDDDDVLELNDQAIEKSAFENDDVAGTNPLRSSVADDAPLPMSRPAVTPEDPIVSAETAQASRAPLDTLSRLVVKPETAGADTLEGLVREMLRPMLSDWLDKNLPDLVESMVAREIARITGTRQP